MSNVRVPGVGWAILIIVAVALAHNNEPYLLSLGLAPWMIELGIAVLIGILKGLELPQLQLDKALDIVDDLLTQKPTVKTVPPPAAPGEGMRSSGSARAASVGAMPTVDLTKLPSRPNKGLRWLVG